MKIRGSYGVIGENVGAPFQHVMGFTPNVNIGYEFEDGKFLGTMAAPGCDQSGLYVGCVRRCIMWGVEFFLC